MSYALTGFTGCADDRSAVQQRVPATISLLGLMLCLLWAEAVQIPTPAPTQSAQPQQPAAAVRIVDPAFCDSQTWPYIDTRCLKRVDKQASNDSTQQSNAVPATVADVSTAAATNQSAIGNTTAVPIQQPQPPTIRVEQPASPPLTGSDGGHGGDIAVTSAQDVSAYPPVPDMAQHHRSRHYHSRGFFGFRF